MEEDVEVIFEAWVLRLTGLDGRSVLRLSSQWKKRYMILIRQHESASILYYSSKPSSLNAAPKGIVVLEPYYRVEKRQNVRGQRYVVSLTTPTKRFVVAVEDERIFHLLSFFLQVQVKLNEDVEEECFVVRPDNTDDQRKIGARGNMCLLHISPWGITVALQLSKCVIVQWPLTCIRNYESTGRGQFVVTVGKRAHMGVGRYVFNTRLTQDNVMYDRLDRYVIDAAGIRNSHADSVSQTSLMEQDSLHSLTYVQSNPQFSNHLRKISRDMYDSLWQHLGGTRLKASSPDLVSDSPHVHQRAFPRSGSMATLDGAAASTSIPTTPRQSLRRKLSSPAAFAMSTSPIRSPDDFSSLPRNFRRTAPAKVTARESKKRIPVELIESEYLHPESAYLDSNYENDDTLNADSVVPAAAAAPLGATASSVTGKPPIGNTGPPGGKQPSAAFKSPHTSISSEPSQSPPGLVLPGARPRLQRQQSRSCEDLITYTEMSPGGKAGNEYVYNNGTPEGASSGVVPNGTHSPDTGAYSYATQQEVELTRAAAQKLAQRRLYVDTSGGGAREAGTTGYTGPGGNGHQEAIPVGNIRKSLVRHSSMKKAMSNPSLLDAEHTQDSRTSPPAVTHPAHRPPLPGPGYQKGAGIERTISHSPTRSLPVTMTLVSPLSASMTSPLKTSLGAAVTAGASPITSRAHFMNTPKGIHTTSKTKVFRKPVTPEHNPTKTKSSVKTGQVKKEEHQRQESTSSGYASGGGAGTESDMRETHC